MSKKGSVCNASQLATKGFGFIEPDGGGDNFFFHIGSTGNAHVADYEVGQRVKFDVEIGRNGKPQAVNIVKDAGGGGGSKPAGGGGGINPFASSSTAPPFPAPGANTGINPFASSIAFPSAAEGGASFGGGVGAASAFGAVPINPFAAAQLPATQSAFGSMPASAFPATTSAFGAALAASTASAFGVAAPSGGFAFGAAAPAFGTPSRGADAAGWPGADGASKGAWGQKRPGGALGEVGRGSEGVCPLTQADLLKPGMTVAKLVTRLLATDTATEVTMRNLLKNRFGIESTQTSAPLVAHEYAKAVLSDARASRQGQQGQLAESQPARKGGVASRLGAFPGAVGAGGVGGVGASGGMGSRLGAVSSGGEGEDTGASVFVRVKGLRTEDDVRKHFMRVDMLLPEGRKCGKFEYVTQDGGDAHVLKFPSPAAASNAAKFGKKKPGDKGAGQVGLWPITKPSDVVKFASRITVDAKRALAGGSPPEGGGGGDDVEGQCAQCGATGAGRVDENDAQFYCQTCWDEMDAVAGGAGESGEGGGGEWAEGDYDEEEEEGEDEQGDGYWDLNEVAGGGLDAEPPALIRTQSDRPPLNKNPAVANSLSSAAAASTPLDKSHAAVLVRPPADKPASLPASFPASLPASFPADASASVAKPAFFAAAPGVAWVRPVDRLERVDAAAAPESARGDAEGAWGYDVQVISTDGTAPSCTTMLSRKEYDRRTQQGRADESGEFQGSVHSISTMERAPDGKASFALAVCRYEFHRGGAGNVFSPDEIRDLDTMHRTIDYCQTKWLTARMINHCAPAGYVLVYKMMHDVIKAISSDMAYLRRHYPSSHVIAAVFERCVRIAMDAHYRQAEDLAVENARNLPWAQKWLDEHGIPNVAMGMHMRDSIGCTRCAGGEGTSIGSHEDYIYKNLMTLVKDVYPELRAKGIVPLHECEFSAYSLVLLSIRQTYQTAIQDLYYNLPTATRKSQQVKLAMELAMCMQMGNYVRFFDLLRHPNTPYLVCCLCHQHMHVIRQKALFTMLDSREKKMMVPTPIEVLVKHMGFHDTAHCEEYLQARGIPFADGKAMLYDVSRSKIKAIGEFELVEHRKVAFITDKMPSEPCLVVGSRPVPPEGAVPRARPNMASARAAALVEQQARSAEQQRRMDAKAAMEKEQAAAAAKAKEEDNKKAREAAAAAAKAEEERKASTWRAAGEMLDKAKQVCEGGDLLKAKEMAQTAKGMLAGAGGNVDSAERVLAMIGEREKEKEKEEEERRVREKKAMDERERMMQEGEASLQGVRNALAAGDLAKAKIRLVEAKQAFAKAAGGGKDLKDLEARVKAKEEEEARERERMRKEEEAREAERQQAMRQCKAALSKAKESAQAATDALKAWQDLVSDVDRLRTSSLGGVKEAVASASVLLEQADAHMVEARSQLALAGGMVVSPDMAEVAAVHRDAHAVAAATVNAVQEEEARREAEEAAKRREKMERQKKRKERPLAPANELATAGWGAGAVVPPASKRRDMFGGGMPFIFGDARANAVAARLRKGELIAAGGEPLDVQEMVCGTLAAHVQIDAIMGGGSADAFVEALVDTTGVMREDIVPVMSMAAGSEGGQATVHVICDSLGGALKLSRKLRDARVKVQGALHAPLPLMLAHVPQHTSWKIVVAAGGDGVGGEVDAALTKWMMGKVGLPGIGGQREFSSVTSPQGGGQGLRVNVHVCISGVVGVVGAAEASAWEGASACVLMVGPIERGGGWEKAAKDVEGARQRLGSGGALVVLVAASRQVSLQLQVEAQGGEVDACTIAAVKLRCDAREQVFMLSAEELLQAASLYGLSEACGYDVCAPQRSLYATWGPEQQQEALPQAIWWLARRSRRVPVVSVAKVSDVVRERAEHLFQCLGNAAAVSMGGMIRGVVEVYNTRCLGDVQALSQSLQSSLAHVPRPCDASIEEWAAVGPSPARSVHLALGEAACLPKPLGLINETLPRSVISGALHASTLIIGSSGGLALANVKQIAAQGGGGGLDAARRCGARMVKEAVLHRASLLQGEVPYVGQEAVWKTICPLPEVTWVWEAAPLQTCDDHAAASTEISFPSSPSPEDAYIESPASTPPPAEEEEEEVDELHDACDALRASVRREKTLLTSAYAWTDDGDAPIIPMDIGLSASSASVGERKRKTRLLSVSDDENDDVLNEDTIGKLDSIKSWLTGALKTFF